MHILSRGKPGKVASNDIWHERHIMQGWRMEEKIYRKRQSANCRKTGVEGSLSVHSCCVWRCQGSTASIASGCSLAAHAAPGVESGRTQHDAPLLRLKQQHATHGRGV